MAGIIRDGGAEDTAWAARAFYAAGSVPAILYLGVFFLYPLAGLLARSLRSPSGEWTVANFLTLWESPLYRQVLARTMVDACLSTVLALALGYPLALFIAGRRTRGPLLMLILTPMLINLTVRLFGWMIILSDQGPINRLLLSLGLRDQPLPLLFTRTAVVLGIAAYTLPFVALTCYGAIRRVDPTLLDAAASLGAGTFYAFRTVMLPLTLPGIIGGASVAFALGASAFIVPLMLGGPKDALMANYAYSVITTLGDWGAGASIGTVLLVLVLIVTTTAGRLERRWGVRS